MMYGVWVEVMNFENIVKFLNFGMPEIFAVIYHNVLCQNDANGIANSEDPDQTSPGAVLSGSALFAQTYLSENLGSLQ